jgi:Tfp pilus assembly protein PilX
VEELTLADREANLLDRELNLRKQEAVFRNREEQLSIRESRFKDREDKLSKRENNIENREQNTLKGSCSKSPNGEAAPPPDFSEVRWDRDSGKLLDIGDLATCSENMRFFANPDNETEGKLTVLVIFV